MRDCAEGPEFQILGMRDCAEGLAFGGAKRRRKIWGFKVYRCQGKSTHLRGVTLLRVMALPGSGLLPRNDLISKSERRRATYGCATSPKGLRRQARRTITSGLGAKWHILALKEEPQSQMCGHSTQIASMAPLGRRALVNYFVKFILSLDLL